MVGVIPAVVIENIMPMAVAFIYCGGAVPRGAGCSYFCAFSSADDVATVHAVEMRASELVTIVRTF
jgi:hypothetical protein